MKIVSPYLKRYTVTQTVWYYSQGGHLAMLVFAALPRHEGHPTVLLGALSAQTWEMRTLWMGRL